MTRGGKRPGAGRPAEFRARTTLTVLLEAEELRALHQLAEARGVSTSALVRRLIQAALRRAGGTIPWP